MEKYKWPLSFVFLGLIFVGLGFLTRVGLPTKDEGIEIITTEDVSGKEIFVDIQGAVEKPDIYQLPSESRVNDVLILAGGLSAEADRSWVAMNINLAQKLIDGAKIYIPEQSDVPRNPPAGGKVGQVSGASLTDKININIASQSQLETLTGIGPAYAQKIIDGRPYQLIEDLLKVSGIGSKTLEKIKDKITVY